MGITKSSPSVPYAQSAVVSLRGRFRTNVGQRIYIPFSHFSVKYRDYGISFGYGTMRKQRKKRTARRASKKMQSAVRSTAPQPDVAHPPSDRGVAERVPIDDAGRVVVPARIRKALGIHGGDELMISMDGDVIQLKTIETALENARKIARRRKKDDRISVVDTFIAERRAEAETD